MKFPVRYLHINISIEFSEHRERECGGAPQSVFGFQLAGGPWAILLPADQTAQINESVRVNLG